MLTSSTFTGCFQPPEYEEIAEAEEPIKVSDEVRNLWQLPTLNDSGNQATHLVMPGIHIANDLVNKKCL